MINTQRKLRERMMKELTAGQQKAKAAQATADLQASERATLGPQTTYHGAGVTDPNVNPFKPFESATGKDIYGRPLPGVDPSQRGSTSSGGGFGSDKSLTAAQQATIKAGEGKVAAGLDPYIKGGGKTIDWSKVNKANVEKMLNGDGTASTMDLATGQTTGTDAGNLIQGKVLRGEELTPDEQAFYAYQNGGGGIWRGQTKNGKIELNYAGDNGLGLDASGKALTGDYYDRLLQSGMIDKATHASAQAADRKTRADNKARTGFEEGSDPTMEVAANEARTKLGNPTATVSMAKGRDGKWHANETATEAERADIAAFGKEQMAAKDADITAFSKTHSAAEVAAKYGGDAGTAGDTGPARAPQPGDFNAAGVITPQYEQAMRAFQETGQNPAVRSAQDFAPFTQSPPAMQLNPADALNQLKPVSLGAAPPNPNAGFQKPDFPIPDTKGFEQFTGTPLNQLRPMALNPGTDPIPGLNPPTPQPEPPIISKRLPLPPTGGAGMDPGSPGQTLPGGADTGQGINESGPFAGQYLPSGGMANGFGDKTAGQGGGLGSLAGAPTGRMRPVNPMAPTGMAPSIGAGFRPVGPKPQQLAGAVGPTGY